MRKFIDRLLIRSEEIVAAPTITRSKNILKTTDHSQAAVLSRCIEEWSENKFSDEERLWLNKILIRWNLLRQSNTIVQIDDFGAGVPSHAHGVTKSVNVGRISVQNSRSPQWLPLMLKLLRELKPNTVLELGTCIGISGMYCAAGLKINTTGTLVTVEGASAYAAAAKENFEAMQLNNVIQYTGRFSDVLQDIMLKHQPIDFVFIDGHHNGDATFSYFEQILPFLSRSAWLVFDDISWSTSMKHAWKRIVDDKRITFSSNLSLIGICYLER